MKFNFIFIANLAEIATFLTKRMDPSQKKIEIFEDHAYCDRFVLAESDHRVLVTPFPLDRQFFRDTNRLLRFKNVINLYPGNVKESICQAILKDKKLLKTLTEIIQKNPKIKIIAYAATKEFQELVAFLRKKGLIFQTPETPADNNLWTVDFFDSKSGFRQAAYWLGQGFPAMPQGVICQQIKEVVGWANHFFQKNGAVVLKINRGLAGEGVEIIRRKDLKGKDFLVHLKRVLKKQPYWQGQVVVEEYIPPDLKIAGGSPSVELMITDQRITPLYACGMRIGQGGVFQGIEFGKRALPKRMEEALFRAGEKFAQLLSKHGYQGYFDIDWVYGQDNRLYPLEANLRRTGGTHAYELAKRLLGENFSHQFYLISQMKTEAPVFLNKNYVFVKEKLSSLFYPIRGQQEGVILTVLSYLQKGKLGYVVIGSNKKRTIQIEKQLLKKLSA